MNSRPWLTDALKAEAPTDEPTPATAGSASDDLGRLLLQLGHGRKEMSLAACGPPKMSPVSSCGKKPFGVLT